MAMFGTKSLWMEEEALRTSPLTENIEAEVVIIGAGIAGLTTAYLLAQDGAKNVVVLEKGSIGCGQTARTTAHLSNAFDDRYFEVERIFGTEGAATVAASHTEAIALMESIAAREGIECDFLRLPGYLLAFSDEEMETLRREEEAAGKAGVPGVRMADAPWEGSGATGALLFPEQAQLHAQKYLNGLARACEKLGVRVFCGTRVVDITEGEPHVLETEAGSQVRAPFLVHATNSPANRNVVIHGRQTPYRTYVIGLEVPESAYPDPVLMWDLPDPYHYVRLDNAPGRILIVGGEDHRTGKATDMDARYARLEEWARKHFPHVGEVRYRWSGQVMEPADGLGIIGKNPGSERVYVITGDSGQGTTHATLGARIIADLIAGRGNPWAELYDPARVALKAVPEYAKDAAATNLEYKEWLTGSGGDPAETLAPGEGAVYRSGKEKICAYRKEDGSLFTCSAVCPHMGCIVAWNPGEKSWDCPCHGSRFSPEGEAIEGPAMIGLEAKDQNNS